MDAFVLRFFEQFQAPGAEFLFDNGPKTYTYMGCSLRVFDGELTMNRHFTSAQPMTPLGILGCTVMGGPSSLDGITKNYLTPEGTVNISSIAETLKGTAGLPTALLSQHVSIMSRWSWADNHVSLIMNMLRYVMLARMQEETTTLDGSFGMYDDGHVQINMDQWWPKEYPELCSRRGWPGGNDDESYPSYLRLTTSTPSAHMDAVDLRGLNATEARFVLLMLGQWKRASRFRLDYSSPRLTDHVYYRSSVEVGGLEDWLGKEPEGAEPELPSWQVAWAALRGYVTQNRLFDHFSVALYCLAMTAYQFQPVTAESTYWLSMDWNLILPAFRSVRGRYDFLNEGEAAYVSHRALSEWGYINGMLEKVNLMCLTFSQAYQTGLALRGVRKGLELDAKDVYNSEIDFYTASNLISAAAAEAVRGDVPMPGMSGVYLTTSEKFDDYDRKRVVLTENDEDDDMDGYDVELSTEEAEVVERVAVQVDGHEEFDQDIINQCAEKVRILNIGIKAKRQEDPKFWLNEDEELALRNTAMMNVRRKRERKRVKIVMPWFTFAGVPTMILPLSTFPYQSPFSLKGVISDEMGKLERRGFRLAAPMAWEAANLLRLCGYDTEIRLTGDTAGANEFFAPNDANMVWPILHEPDSQEDPIIIIGQRERDYRFIDLPPVYSRFFRGKKIEYSVRVNRRGTMRGPKHDKIDVSEWGGAVTLTRDVTVSYNIPEGVARLRGFISRDEKGFRFAASVQAGMIPPAATEANAQGADA